MTGGMNLRDPTGGVAYGTPRKTSTGSKDGIPERDDAEEEDDDDEDDECLAEEEEPELDVEPEDGFNEPEFPAREEEDLK